MDWRTHGVEQIAVIHRNRPDVQREQMPPILGVRYHAVVGQLSNFIRIIPKVGSAILCGIIENDLSEAVALAYSEIEKGI